MADQNKVTLTVAGCGDAFGSSGNSYACYLLEAGGKTMLIDCGATAIPSLKRHGLDGAMADVILISHFHGDHFGGLPFLFLDASIMRKRKKELHLIGPPGLKQKLKQLTALLYPGSESVLESFPVHYYSFEAGKEISAGGFSIRSFKVKHSKKTDPHGARIRVNGRTIGYSGDTGWCEELAEIADGADLFLCECNFMHTKMSMHLDLQTLQKNAERLRARTILLTHLGEEMMSLQRQGRTGGFIIAREGLEISV